VTPSSDHPRPTRAGASTPAGNEEPTELDTAGSEPTAIGPVSFGGQPTYEEIAAEAYAIYEARGSEHGQHDDDWHEAERRLKSRPRTDADNL
jgi:Protein of unknown function (DUF2934)